MKHLLIGVCLESDDDTELLVQQLKIAEIALDIKITIRTYQTGKKLLYSFSPAFDMLFIKFPLANVDGELLLSQIRRCDPRVDIVLISESDDYYRLGYKYNAQNYLVKPARYRNIYSELKKHLSENNLSQMPYIWITIQREYHKLYLHKIRYIETCGHQLCIHYTNEDFYYNGKMATIAEQLPKHFFRCNNSYVVNAEYISSVRKDINRYKITLITGETLPLTKDKKKEMEKVLWNVFEPENGDLWQ